MDQEATLVVSMNQSDRQVYISPNYEAAVRERFLLWGREPSRILGDRIVEIQNAAAKGTPAYGRVWLAVPSKQYSKLEEIQAVLEGAWRNAKINALKGSDLSTEQVEAILQIVNGPKNPAPKGFHTSG